MKTLTIILMAIILSASVRAGDQNGNAETCSTGSSGIVGVNRVSGNQTFLVLQKDHSDLVVIPDTPIGIIPKLQSAYIDGNKLAVVVDWDFYFRYQLYELQNGTWSKLKDVPFSAMGRERRLRLAAVEMTDLSDVILIYNKDGQDIGRKKGIVFPEDPKHIFLFKDSGTFRNGHPYHFREDQPGPRIE